ncbi:DUF928 domain-containing protein [Anabaena azotica]|uniref:DUF928 domain-containing protein n=1 Tax=Anabaena azotica TaxID=197653 RepID=UPI0039A6C7FB
MIKRSLLQKTITICTLTTLCSGSLLSPIFLPQAQAQSAFERIQSIFTGRTREGSASGRSRGGATRSKCSQIDSKNLIALAPENNEGLTTKEYPEFWFYLPFGGDSQSPPAKFRLQDEQKKSVLTKPLQLPLPDKKGIVHFSLPKTEKPLSVDQRYRWYFTITCTNDEGSETKISVDGWIKRIEANSTLVQQLNNTPPQNQYVLYAENNIWHETISQLAQYRTIHQDDWSKLLSLYDLGEFAPSSISELNPL